MRALHAVFGIVMLGFAAVQYNDPDGIFWALVYLLAAAWSGLAAWRPAWLGGRRWLVGGMVVSGLLFLVGFATLAPTIGADWIHVEEARESLGYLIAAGTTLLAALGIRGRANDGTTARA